VRCSEKRTCCCTHDENTPSRVQHTLCEHRRRLRVWRVPRFFEVRATLLEFTAGKNREVLPLVKSQLLVRLLK
jgi:hypothetical protein